MNKTYGQAKEEIFHYVEKTFRPKDETLKTIQENSERAEIPSIQVGAMDGLHLEVITRAVGVKNAVEIGTLGGYSGTCIARALKPGGKLYTLEISEHNAQIAKMNFALAGVLHSVEILLAPALESLKSLETKGPFDMVFIDADKVNYPAYLQWAVKNVRLGGVILADNTFAWGLIADQKGNEDEHVLALRQYNTLAANHPQLRTTILPTGEGLTFSVKLS